MKKTRQPLVVTTTVSMLKIHIQNQEIASCLVDSLSLVLIKKVILSNVNHCPLNILVVAPERTEVTIDEEGEKLVQENAYQEEEGTLSKAIKISSLFYDNL